MISARESMKKELYQAQAHLTRVQTALARLPEEFEPEQEIMGNACRS